MLLIAIDGPAGSGKSSISCAVAERLGVAELNTGAPYRAVALLALRDAVDLDKLHCSLRSRRRHRSLFPEEQTGRTHAAMLAPGTGNYRFEARAVDRAGNGSWSAGGAFQVGNYPETASAVTYGGTGWTSGNSTNFFGGSVKHHEVSGRKANLTFTGATQVGWVTTESQNRGKAKVSLYQGTTLLASVTRDTYAPSTVYRQMLHVSDGLDPAKSYKLVVEMLGTNNADNTTNSTRVAVDSFVVIR